jgi:hypothetical protein
MSDVVTSILTDASTRTDTAVEELLLQQAVAIPWVDAPSA